MTNQVEAQAVIDQMRQRFPRELEVCALAAAVEDRDRRIQTLEAALADERMDRAG